MNKDDRRLVELQMAQHSNLVLGNMLHQSQMVLGSLMTDFNLVVRKFMQDVADMSPDELHARAKQIEADLLKPKENKDG